MPNRAIATIIAPRTKARFRAVATRGGFAMRFDTSIALTRGTRVCFGPVVNHRHFTTAVIMRNGGNAVAPSMRVGRTNHCSLMVRTGTMASTRNG